MPRKKMEYLEKMKGRTVNLPARLWLQFDEVCKANGYKPSKALGNMVKSLVENEAETVRKWKMKNRLIEMLQGLNSENLTPILQMISKWVQEPKKDHDFVDLLKEYVLKADIDEDDVKKMQKILEKGEGK